MKMIFEDEDDVEQYCIRESLTVDELYDNNNTRYRQVIVNSDIHELSNLLYNIVLKGDDDNILSSDLEMIADVHNSLFNIMSSLYPKGR